MEAGGLNLYGFVRNNPINAWDYLGMSMMAAVSTHTKVETYVDEDGEWEVQYSDVSDVAYGMPEWVEDGRALVRPATALIDRVPNNAGLTLREGAGAFISGLGEGAYDAAMAFRALPEALGRLAGDASVDFSGTVRGVLDTLMTNIANGATLASETSLADIRRDIVTAVDLYLNDPSSRQAVTNFLAGTGTSLVVGAPAANLSQVSLPTLSPNARLILINTIEAMDDGTLLGRLPNPRTANPPVAPPAIIHLVDGKPVPGAGPPPRR